jgi:hypothetical protein
MTASLTAAATRSKDSFGASKATAASSVVSTKLDVLFTGFIVLALIVEGLRISVNTP